VWAGQLRQLQRSYGLKLVRGLLVTGMSVRLQVTTAFHPRYGLRVVVQDVDPSFTIGELERKRQATLAQLSKDGLLNRNGGLPFPLVPRRLAVISSDTAAGLADFREQLDGNPYGYRFGVRLFPAAMQGPQTGPEIISRLRQIRGWDDAFDAVVIVRGGGGRTDLAAFDDEALCRAVAEYHLPVVVGVGHETDDSVLDRVAARSLKTPTATAVFLIECLMAAELRALQLGRAVVQAGRQQLFTEGPKLERYQLLARQLATGSIAGEARRLAGLQQYLRQAERRALTDRAGQLEHLERLLAALRPSATLARGYALVSQEGRIIISPEDISDGPVAVKLRDGTVKLNP